MDVTIPPDDKAAYAMVMSGLRECRNIRTDVDAWHKDKKAWIVKAGKHYDGERRRIHDLIGPIEDHLKDVRFAEDDRKEQIELEKERIERERVEGIRAKIAKMKVLALSVGNKTAAELHTIMDNLVECEAPEAEFMEFKAEAEKVLDSTIETVKQALIEREKWEQEQAAAKAEAERLEKQKAEQEAERLRLEAIQKEADEKARKEREALDAERRQIEAEKAAIELSKKMEKEKQERAAFEAQAREQAKARAEAEAKLKVEREAREAAEKAEKERIEKERKAAMAPDKEKLIKWAMSFNETNNPSPALKSKEAQEILRIALEYIEKILQGIIEEAEEL
jgi:chemotaxis protein histidine kinase CheA